MKNWMVGSLLILLGCFCSPVLAEQDQEADSQALTQEQQEQLAWAKGIWDSLDRKTGEIALSNGVARLQVPDSFYYLGPQDAEKVLVEVWGNMPGSGANTLGMLFPSESTPFDEGAWAVTIEYTEEGYVSDEDANDIDYDELLVDMQKDTRADSKDRVRQGYDPIELVGWASAPFYDEQSHKLHWAQELKFGDREIHTLNYNIRVLGRKGVLVLNFISDMSQKPVIDANLDSVLAMAEFEQGSRYEDFNPDLDKVAAYGIGALVAGKVIAKTGILAAALIFLKKFGIFILIGLGAFFRKLFGKKEVEAADTDQ